MSVQSVGGTGLIFDVVQLMAETQMRTAQNLIEVSMKAQLSADELSNIQTAQSAFDIRV